MKLAEQLTLFAKTKKPGMNNDYRQVEAKPNRRSKDIRHKKRELLRKFNNKEANARTIAELLAIDLPELHSLIGIKIKTNTFPLDGKGDYVFICRDYVVDATDTELQHNDIIQAILSSVFNTLIYGSWSSTWPLVSLSRPIRSFDAQKPISVQEWNAFVSNVNANMTMIELAGPEAIKTLWATRHLKDEPIKEEYLPELELEVLL